MMDSSKLTLDFQIILESGQDWQCLVHSQSQGAVHLSYQGWLGSTSEQAEGTKGVQGESPPNREGPSPGWPGQETGHSLASTGKSLMACIVVVRPGCPSCLCCCVVFARGVDEGILKHTQNSTCVCVCVHECVHMRRRTRGAETDTSPSRLSFSTLFVSSHAIFKGLLGYLLANPLLGTHSAQRE